MGGSRAGPLPFIWLPSSSINIYRRFQGMHCAPSEPREWNAGSRDSSLSFSLSLSLTRGIQSHPAGLSLSLILATGFDRFISVAHAAAVRCPSAQWHQIRRNERERGRTKEEGRGGGERAYEGVGIARSPLLLSRAKRLCFFL